MVLLCYQMLQSVTKYILSNLQILLKKKKKYGSSKQNCSVLLQSKLCNPFKAKVEFPRGHFTVAGLKACSATQVGADSYILA